MQQVDTVVIGAGVVGLAIARAFAVAGRETIIVDGERSHGSWTSARNSEVIHAGIYYPEGSLKAALCVRGRELLYDYCRVHDVPHARIGKLIFAADASQTAALDTILASAHTAGVDDLRPLSGSEVRALEPALACHAALLSPSTGIIDSHGFMAALLGEASAHGAMFAGDSKVARLSRQPDGWGIHIGGDTEPTVIARNVINSGGLTAHQLALATEGLSPEHIPAISYARGVYFTYAGRVPFRRLIYPVPVAGGLGTHLTLDLAGNARFGPDVEWIDAVDYTVDPTRHAAFHAAARLIWPDLDPARLQPGFAGIRPKIGGPGSPTADFRIDGPARHGLAGLVNLFGIESPGLTSSLAIAEMVLANLAE